MRKPDFAYPATVSADAERQLQTAISDRDAVSALRALMDYTLAQTMIDREKIQESIRLAESTAEKMKDSDIYGIYLSLIAELYDNAYSQKRWIYDAREQPLLPLPDNITEWSGAQYEAKIHDLVTQSISPDNIAKLHRLNIADYSVVIDADALTASYYPTLADFVYCKALEMSDTSSHKDIIERAIEDSKGETAAQLLWKYLLVTDGVVDYPVYTSDDNNQSNTPRDKILSLFDEYRDSKYAGLLVYKMIEYTAMSDIDERKFYVTFARDYLSSVPECLFKNNIMNGITRALSGSFQMDTQRLCVPGQKVELNILVESVNHIKIDIYYIGDNCDFNRLEKEIAGKRPMRTLELDFDGVAPFQCDTVVDVQFDKAGYYVLNPYIAGDKPQYPDLSLIHCVSVYPIAMTDVLSHTDVVVVNPFTGAPIDGASVKVVKKDKVIETALTGHDGIATLKYKDGSGAYINIAMDGKTYDFSDVMIPTGSYYYEDRVSKKVNLLTDRSIYHQGDEIMALGIFYSCINSLENGYSADLLADTDVIFMLRDANYQPVDTVETHTDKYGRATAKFSVPTDRMTGKYVVEGIIKSNDDVVGSRYVMVSDYKMPDYTLDITSVACDVPVKGSVTVSAQAMTYSGMPVADAKIDVQVRRFERGFWWRSANSTAIYSVNASTDGDGKLTVVLPDSVFAGDIRNLYSVTLTAVSATGEAIDATEYFTLTAQYNITLNIKENSVNGELPLTADVSVVDAEGKEVDIPLVWKLVKDNVTVASGDYDGEIDLRNVKPATYRLSIGAKDAELADEAYTTITVYNKASGIVPDDAVLWCEKDAYDIGDTDRLDILIGTGDDDVTLYYALTTDNKVIYVKSLKVGTGYHDLSVDLPNQTDSYEIRVFTVKYGKFMEHNIAVNRIVYKGLKVVGVSFRDRLTPTASETWQLKVTYADGRPLEAALALDMYNKALDALYPHSFSINFFGKRSLGYFRINTPYDGIVYSRGYTQNKFIEGQTLTTPTFQLYGYGFMGYRYSRSPMLYSKKRELVYNTANMGVCDDSVEYEMEECASMDAVMVTGSTDMMNAKVEAEGDISEPQEAQSIDYRDSDVPLAIWAPDLTTDADGNICYTFTVPNANTTWCLNAVAWSQDMEVGRLMREFVASKPVMVQPNLPRFLRAGDTATVIAAVMNSSDSTSTIKTTVELFNPLTSQIIKSETFTDTIGPKQTATVSVTVNALSSDNAVGYRVKATNGDFTDGEQAVIRVLPSVAQLIETQPFYLNPGESEFVTKLPSDPDARISLTFCENPVWTIVSALPGLRTNVYEYANSAAAAIFSASISQGILNDNPEIAEVLKTWLNNPSDSALISMLEKNEDLKIAVLNCTPWVQAAQSDTERMANLSLMFDQKSIDGSINNALKILSDLQQSDGGWAWGKWCNKSSVWVTSNVLGMLGSLKHSGWLTKDKSLDRMINKAVKYYDNAVEDTDILYCLTRPYFSDIPVSNNGKKVTDNTLKEIRKNWKKYTDPAYKAMAAEALYLNGDDSGARELMRSISEFGVYTESQGLKFPSVNSLYSYAILLEAYGMINPDSKEVDGLRQQLIVRKQATDWGDAVVTSEVVKSILTTGTKWTVAANGAEIQVGDDVIEPNGPIETATGQLTANLSQYAGDTLTITTSPTGPSYGAVYSQFSRKMDQVKASACDDLDIEKTMTVRRGKEWYAADSLSVGDRVKVQLTIHCKRNLQYVSIVDERPAAFEPVEQLPGWIWSEGVAFYRENRDAETDMHVIYMTPGTYILTYEMNVNVAGTFSSGVATIQSQYAPELSAHSSGCIININNKK